MTITFFVRIQKVVVAKFLVGERFEQFAQTLDFEVLASAAMSKVLVVKRCCPSMTSSAS
jgi:hypothetical protein